MKAETFLASRFLSGKKRRFFVSFLTAMAVAGVALSVMAFIVVQGVMSGFAKDLQSKVIGFSPHLSLKLKSDQLASAAFLETLKQKDGVRRSATYLEGEAVLRTDDDEVQGVRLRGIEAGDPHFPPSMKVHFEEGEDWSSLQPKGEALPGILLGREMASSLGVVPALLEEIELLYPFGTVGPTGEVEPNLRRFRVVGTFRSGYFEYDNKFAIAALPELQRLFGDNAALQVGVYFDDPDRAASDRAAFGALDGVAATSTWQERNSRLFSALKLERLGMIVVLSLMTLLASFNILCMLMLVVFERRRDLALLKALGLPERGISAIFYRAGLWIGVVGGVLGLGGGLLLIWGIRVSGIRPPAPYYLESLPVDLQPGVIALTVLLALALSLAAAVLPAREGRKMTVVEALRYE